MTNENTTIDFKVKLDKNDFVDFTFYAIIHRKNSTVMKIILTILSVLLIFMVITSMTPPNPNIIFGISILCFPLLFGAILYYTAIQTFKSSKRLHEEFHYTIDNEKVTIKGESFDSNFDRKFISKVGEGKKAFYLWQSSNSANIIPKRFLSEKEISFFRACKTQQ